MKHLKTFESYKINESAAEIQSIIDDKMGDEVPHMDKHPKILEIVNKVQNDKRQPMFSLRQFHAGCGEVFGNAEKDSTFCKLVVGFGTDPAWGGELKEDGKMIYENVLSRLMGDKFTYEQFLSDCKAICQEVGIN